jgi:hypothetical protein
MDRPWKPTPDPAQAPSPTNLVEAKEQGIPIGPGTQITAPLAPKSGPVPGKSGDFVVGVLKDFWESPTIKALRNAVVTAVGLGVLAVVGQVLAANGDLWAVNWQTTQKIAIAATAFSLASAYAAWWKRKDNDPIKQGPKPPEQG